MGLLALAGLLATSAAAQSLGDYARQQRTQKPATPAGAKVYTNDNLPTAGTISQVGQPAPSPEPVSPKAAAAAEKAEQKKAEDQKKQEAEWRAKFAEQNKNIKQLQRDLEILIRENKLRLHGNYGITAAADQSYQAEIAEKQQALDEAKQKLEKMKDDLRRDGLPASWAE
jgi:hypothetical protein